MIEDIVEVRSEGDYRLWLRFEDGVEGVADLRHRLEFTGVFEPLRDPEEFAKVRVDPESGTVVWPTGADLDPVVLRSLVTGEPIVGSAAEDPEPYGR